MVLSRTDVSGFRQGVKEDKKGEQTGRISGGGEKSFLNVRE